MIFRMPLRGRRSTALWGSESARELLVSHGFRDAESTFARLPRGRLRRAGRAVMESTLVTPDGGAVRAFVKLDFGRRWWPRMTDLKTGQAWQSLPLREWRGIERLAALGFAVPQRLGLFCDGFWQPRAAVIVAAVPPPDSIDALVRSGEWQRLDPADRDAILDGVVSTIRRIHAEGLAWRGICTRHYFPARQPDGSWKLWLIDLEGIHRRRGTKAVARDYGKLERALAYSGADAETLKALAAKLAR